MSCGVKHAVSLLLCRISSVQCIPAVQRGVDSTLAHCVHVEYATKCACAFLQCLAVLIAQCVTRGGPKKVAIAHRQNRVIYPHQPQPPSPLTAPLSLARVQTRHKLGPQQKQNTNTEPHTNYQIENTMRLQGRTKNNL